MTDYNPLKAQQEVVAGCAQMHKVITTKTTEAEKNFGEAEAELNAMRQVHAFSKQQLEQEQQKLRQLQQEAEEAARAKT